MFPRTIGRLISKNGGIRRLNSKASVWADGEIISNRDLFRANMQLNSNRKIPYQGAEPKVFKRSSVEFESEYSSTDEQLSELLALDKEFPVVIDTKFQGIQSFIGEHYHLSVQEKTAILFGRRNMSIALKKVDKSEKKQSMVPSTNASEYYETEKSEKTEKSEEKQNTFRSTNASESYETEKLRGLGEALFHLHLNMSTTFAKSNYLSLSSADLESRMSLFQNKESIICLFMKRHLLYDTIPPDRGANKGVSKISRVVPEERAAAAQHIRDYSCVGSFYTLIGILATKFDQRAIVKNLLYKRILNGPVGIINLSIQKATA